MNLELISFKICPFVQRTVITLLLKDIPHKVTYIDLSSPPDWFQQLSPFGKVPILKVNDDLVIFESAIINEYLNDLASAKLLPSDPLERAINRCWIDFGTNLTLDFSTLIHAGSSDEFDSTLSILKNKFDRLEDKLANGPWFNDENFSLVDIAYAPLFMRSNILNLGDLIYPPGKYPKISAWAQQLLSLPELSKSVVSDFNEIFINHIINKAPYAARRMGVKESR